MSIEIQTRHGRCATHGAVEAARELPRITFPPIINAVRRSLAKRRPFLCPTCAEPVETG